MSIDPDQIRRQSFSRTLRGYAPDEVQELLEQLAQIVGALSEERDGLARRVEAETAGRAAAEAKVGEVAEQQQALVRTFDEAAKEREELVSTFEDLRREREELLAYTQRMEQELVRFRELESSLTQALVAAERSANDLRVTAQREAETILAEARVEARRIVQQAGRRREQLLDDARAIRGMLTNALETIDERRLRVEPPVEDEAEGGPPPHAEFG